LQLWVIRVLQGVRRAGCLGAEDVVVAVDATGVGAVTAVAAVGVEDIGVVHAMVDVVAVWNPNDILFGSSCWCELKMLIEQRGFSKVCEVL
jgi:hypothetical protein